MAYQYQASLYSNNAQAETPVSPMVSDFPLPSSSAPLPLATERNDAIPVSPPRVRDSYASHKMPRSPSISSISNASTFNSTIATTPANIYPPPAYIAQFGAAQVVSERKRRFSDADNDDDDVRTVTRSSRDDMHFSPASLALVNGFLDQLLYSFLGNAKSTTLTALRPAVKDVLKSRIASEAIASAEEELQELLAGGEDEEDEMDEKQTAAERKRAWDTELVWKRTRLRVMVYIRLGEMETEDEERYVRETELFHGSDRRFSHSTGLVSWAAAIFLTSVLEFLAEQVLQAAGHAADVRARRQSKNPPVPMSSSGKDTPVDGVTVEDYDMEKVALNSALGRLWRTWRKSLRSNVNGGSASHNFSRRLSRDPFSPTQNSFGSGGAAESVSAMDDSRRPSLAVNDKDNEMDDSNDVPEAEYTEDILAANIPLPLSDEKRDVDEIEVPGLSRDPDEAESQTQAELKRRNSLTGFAPYTLVSKVLATMGFSDSSEDSSTASTPAKKPVLARQRSHSVPTQARSVFPLLEADNTEADAPLAADSVQEHGKDNEEPQESDADKSSEVENTDTPRESSGQDDADHSHEEASVAPKSSVDEAEEDPPFVEAEEYQTNEVSRRVGVSSDLKETEGAVAPETDSQVGSEEPSKLEDGSREGAESKAEAQPKSEEHSKSEDTITTVKALKAEDANAQEASHNQDDDPTQEQSEFVERQVEESPRRSLLKGLVPGSAAAAEAAFLIVYGDKFSKKEARTSVPTPSTEEAEKNEQEAPVDMKRLSMPAGVQSTPIQTIMEVPQSQEVEEPVGEAQDKVEQPRVMVRDRSPTIESQDTFSLGSRNGGFGAHQQMYVADVADAEDVDDVANIGIARTSDVREEEAPVEHRAARDTYRDSHTTPHRQSRLILVGSPDSPTSPRRREAAIIEQDVETAKSPEDVLAERSLVSPKSADLEQAKAQSSALQQQTQSASHRKSVPGALVVAKGRNSPPGVQEKAPSPSWRQSFSAATEKTASWVSSPRKASPPSETLPDVPVQEHPVVQRMASMKRTGSHEKEDKYPLTSASIRGPEDFDMFVQGGDTLKYTLTPENVRDEPAVRAGAEAGQEAAASQPRTSSTTERTAPTSIPQPLEMRPGRSQSIKQVTSATPVPEDFDDSFQPRKNADKRRSISRPPARNTSVHRRSGLLAREPQVVTESTRDFADFIRSTGPSKDQEVTPILTSKSTTSLHSLRQGRASSRSSSPGGASLRSLNRSAKRSETAPPMPAMPQTKSHMLPRSATLGGDGSSDLINFIRSGPNDSTTEPGQKRKHRISRTIAPFRTTMDSDQLQEWGDRIVAQPDLKLNTAVATSPSLQSSSSLKSSSHRTSANSRSALLPSASTSVETSQPAYSGQAQRLSMNALRTPTSAPAPAEPTVKRYRNKDPYAIDISDEDDDLLTALPHGKREEESLIDFLKSTDPNQSAPTTATPQALPQNSSLPENNTSTHDRQNSHSSLSNSPRGTTSIAIGAIPKPKPKHEPRAGSNPSENTTGDLADFLRSSGPPGGTTTPPFARQSSRTSILSGSKSEKKRKGFFNSSFFSRKPATPTGTIGRAYNDL